ncbi:MAG TPA: thioredoxin family protein [Chitinophagaceae bacterium]|nr:thioredoxin family protein [Chitinophagaceae bacterium]
MKKLLLLPLVAVLCSFTGWHYDLKEAEQIARNQHRYIILNFSGSDWCGPCIRLHNEIFGSDVFSKFADTALVMVNADFPRMKKNQLSKQQQAINDALADKYNANGDFPLTVLLNEDGKVIKQWVGFPKGTADDFVFDVKAAIDGDSR